VTVYFKPAKGAKWTWSWRTGTNSWKGLAAKPSSDAKRKGYYVVTFDLPSTAKNRELKVVELSNGKSTSKSFILSAGTYRYENKKIVRW
jgi:hypothetical protein